MATRDGEGTNGSWEEAAALLRKCVRPLFLTGAGLSADSGLPTYRGTAGLYDGQDAEDGIAIEEVLSGSMLRRRPELTWKHLYRIGRVCRGAKPNAGHAALAEIERRIPDTLVLTQNVDGLHHAAGSRNVVEVHGTFRTLTCLRCVERFPSEQIFPGGEIPPEAAGPVPLPICPTCAGPIRPDVVLFGEMLPEAAIVALDDLFDHPPDLVAVVGTSGQFPYIQQPFELAHEVGLPTIEINPQRTALSDFAAFRFDVGAAEALNRLVRTAFPD